MLIEFLKQHGQYFDDKYFKDLTTIKMGGHIKHFVLPNSINDLKEIIYYLRSHKLEYKVLGNGSNLICGEDEFEGVIIKLDKLNDYEIKDEEVYVQAGVLAPYFANVLAKLGLSGFEFASGIPGSIGGLVYMNAGAYKSNMSDIIEEVEVLRRDEIITLKKDELKFRYRYSIFQEHPHWIILSCKIHLKKDNPQDILDLMNDRLKRRKETQPLDKPSAGSCFRNPEGKAAWQLIDDIGYRGYKLGGTKVSEKHSNFIINDGNGNAKEYLSIAYDIMDKVKEKDNIKLILEVEKFNC